MHPMQKLLAELHDTVHTMHRLPKLLLKYGGMLVIFLFTASAAAYLCAGRLSEQMTADKRMAPIFLLLRHRANP